MSNVQFQDIGNKTNASQRSSLSISSHDSNKDGVVEHPRPNHRKNRQAPKPPTQQPKSLDESVINNMAESASNLEIRAPSELLLGFPTGLRTQWRHSAEILIASAVKYEVNVSRRIHITAISGSCVKGGNCEKLSSHFNAYFSCQQQTYCCRTKLGMSQSCCCGVYNFF